MKKRSYDCVIWLVHRKGILRVNTIEVKVIPLIFGSLGGGVKRIQKNIKNILAEKTAEVKIVQGMQEMVLMESESIMGRTYQV